MKQKFHIVSDVESSNPRGLTAAEVTESRRKYGNNIIHLPEREPLWKAYLAKLHDPLIVVLLVVLSVSMSMSAFEFLSLPSVGGEIFLEPFGILVALLLATGVGFLFEVRAIREYDVLCQVDDETPVRVLRHIDEHEQMTEIPRRDVVVGDIVAVESGDEIPADGYLIRSAALSVDESSLTGEPETHKSVSRQDTNRSDSAETVYAIDQLMRGSTVREGNGLMCVTAVGDDTAYGHVAAATSIDNHVVTPLDRQLRQLGNLLSAISFWVAGAIVLGRLFYFFFFDGDASNNDTISETLHYFLNSIMIAVTLIVVAVPEGLPLSITLSLALSMRRMLKENNLVRRLHACETMGATTVICTDKTGTLTENRMRVAAIHNYSGDDILLAESIAVNSTAWLDGDRVLGNPTEGALLLWLRDGGRFDYEDLRRSIVRDLFQKPFSPETKRMTTTVWNDRLGCHVTYVKGAPEVLLADCVEVAGGTHSTTVATHISSFQRQAMRTLGFAVQIGDGPLSFVASCGISDPVRREVPAAIAACHDASIRVVVVTGDTLATAAEVAHQCGIVGCSELTNDETVSGSEFAAMDDVAALAILPRLRILWRARPLDKQRLVRLLQMQGEVVAVTGDGTNDAPALKAAQIGLSMGDGSAVAKAASDITIVDNSFRSIVNAVLWGRSLYANIGRFILFQMTVNVAACIVVLFGAFTGRESPLSVPQMLWVNLIMDTFAAMALSALPPDSYVLLDKPRNPETSIITRPMLFFIFWWGGLFSIVLLYCWMQPVFWPSASVVVPHEWFFTIFVMLQFWNLFNARLYGTRQRLAINVRAFFNGENMQIMRTMWNPAFVGIALLILIGQIFIVTFGGEMFSIERPLSGMEWLTIFVATSLVVVVGEAWRLLFGRHDR